MSAREEREVIVTIDVGTSSARVAAHTLDGRTVGSFARRYSPTFSEDGRVRQDPRDWQTSVHALLDEIARFLGREDRDPVAVSLASQRASVIPIDADGEALSAALMWQDTSTQEECDLIGESIPEDELYLRTGMRVHPYFSASRILWLRRHQPEIYRRAARVVGVQDYVAFLLTGRFVTDHTQASRTLLFNVSTLDWDDAVLSALALERDKLPPVVAPGSVIGATTADLGERTGFPVGVPVVAAGGDQQVAAVGLGVGPLSGIGVNNGTGAFVFATTEEPVFDRERRTLCTPGAAAGTWNVEAGTLATGAVYQWFSRELEGSLQVREAEGADAGAENAGTLDALSRRAQASPVGANGVVLLPSFAGMAAPDWNPAARGVLMNLRLSTSLADVARAAIEGVALEIAGNVHLVRSVSGAEARVVAAGGLTQSTLFLRSLTDALDLPVSVSGIMEATTRGAMISAAVALDIHDSFATAIGRLIPEPARTLDPIPDNVAVLAQHRTYRAHLHGALSRERLYAGAQALGDQRR